MKVVQPFARGRASYRAKNSRTLSPALPRARSPNVHSSEPVEGYAGATRIALRRSKTYNARPLIHSDWLTSMTRENAPDTTENPAPKKLYIKTWGCQMNEYDSQKMGDVLDAANGMQLTETPEEADVILLNTCSIREKAQEKVFSQLGQWKELKRAKPALVIGVGGCVASQEGAAIRDRAPFVDMVFGPQTLHRLPEMIQEVRSSGRAVVDIAFPEIEKFDNLPEPRAEGATAFVTVMEGCSKYCTFCVVPYTRGEEISRPFDDVLTECAQLAAQGVREINLLGQNVNAYRGAMHDGGIADLALLIEFVATIDGIERIRFTTSHPVEFTDRLIEAYRNVPKLASFLHLPVQSGSDRVLAAMKRGHTARVQVEDPQAARGAAGHLSVVRLHHRLPRRDRG